MHYYFEEFLHYILWYLPKFGIGLAALLMIMFVLAIAVPNMYAKSNKNSFVFSASRGAKIKKGKNKADYRLD